MDTFWTTRRPGDCALPISAAVEDRGPFGEEGRAILFGDLRIPDRFRLPDDCPIPGPSERRVVGHSRTGCPKHDPENFATGDYLTTFELEGEVFVSECVVCGFVVFTLDDPEGPDAA